MVANTRFDLLPVPGGSSGRIGVLTCACVAQSSDKSLESSAAVPCVDFRLCCCWWRCTFADALDLCR